MSWNIVETLRLVEQRHGEALSDSAAASLHSANQRVRFAHIHYHAMRDLLADFSSDAPQGAVLGLGWDRDEEVRSKYFEFRDKMSANAVACVQSIHAVADLLANGVYFSLKLERFGKPLRESQIDAKRTLQRLDSHAELAMLAGFLRTMLDDASFKHVDALSNHAKHRSITPTALNEDVTGLREPRFELRFSSFERDGNWFDEIEVQSLLSPAYDAVSRAIVSIGNELTRLLKFAQS